MQILLYVEDVEVPSKEDADALCSKLRGTTGLDFTWEDTTPEWNMD